MKVALVILLCLFSRSSSSHSPSSSSHSPSTGQKYSPSSNHHVVRTIKAPLKSKSSSSHLPVTKTITHKSRKDKCTEPAFISTWLKNTTTTKMEDAQLCVNITVVETEETTRQVCEQVTFTPCSNVATKECINVVRTVLEEKTEKICIDETNTVCNMVVDTNIEFVDKTVCNKVCTEDCSVSTVTICDDGTRDVEDTDMFEDCKDELKEECHAGPERCELEYAEECTNDPEPSYQESSYGAPSLDYAPVHLSPSHPAPSSHQQPQQDPSPTDIYYYSVPISSQDGSSYRSKRSVPTSYPSIPSASSSYPSPHSPSSFPPQKSCKKVPHNVCHATTECQQIPVQTCTEVIVATVKQVPTCHCREKAVQICNPIEEEVCTVVSEPKITQIPREVCTDRPRTICEDRTVTIPTTKNEEMCVDLSTKNCKPFTKEVCIDIPSLEVKKVQKEVCTKIPDSEVISTAESHDKEVKTIKYEEKKVYKKYGEKPKTSKYSHTKRSAPEVAEENEAEPATH